MIQMMIINSHQKLFLEEEALEHSNIYIPRKSMFKQDEVCTLTGVKPYVLRFWENELAFWGNKLASGGN